VTTYLASQSSPGRESEPPLKRGGVYCLIFDADSTEKYKQHEGDWLRDCEEDSVIRRDADGNKIYLQREIMGLSVDDAAVVERVSGNKFDYKKSSLKRSDRDRAVPRVPRPSAAKPDESTYATVAKKEQAYGVRFTNEHLRSMGWGMDNPSLYEKRTDESASECETDSDVDEVEFQTTSHVPVMIKRKYEWKGAPGLTDMVKKMTGCQLMKDINSLSDAT